MSSIGEQLAQLTQEVRQLRAEAEARRLLGRYMFLCDSPLPQPDVSDEERARAIGDLFTEDGIWEGVGGTHGAQFGRHVGPAAIAAHMTGFYTASNPRQVFNTHYLCSEQLWATVEGAEGQWVQFQPWIYDDGHSLIRSSRLHVRFRPTDGGWRISHYRTENLFIGDLPDRWWTTHLERSQLIAPAQDA
ncbi:nuclear transport factor 2 family protein [Modestobacter sp. URMC 112]